MPGFHGDLFQCENQALFVCSFVLRARLTQDFWRRLKTKKMMLEPANVPTNIVFNNCLICIALIY